MFERKRIAIELIAAGLVVIIALGVLWLLASSHLQSKRQRAASVRQLADQIRFDVVQARRREKDFLLRDLRSTEFYQLVESAKLDRRSENLRLHANLMNSLQKRLTELSRHIEQEEVTELAASIHRYREIFATIVSSYRQRGYKDWGLVGQWRAAAHAIEQHAQSPENTDLRIALLELRRHEKDYLLRGLQYEQVVHDGVGELRKTIENDAGLSKLISEYEQAFDKYVAIERRIGTAENAGLQNQMREAAHAAESAAADVAVLATTTERDVQRKHVQYSIAILLMGTIAGVFTFYRVAQSIVRPLTELREVAVSLGHHEMDTRVETKATNEVGDLAVAFNRLLDRLQEAFQRERRFSDNAAHQLRTPLTIIKGEIDVTMRQPRSPREYKTCLSKVSQVNEEMSQIVESLLFLSRAPKQAMVADSDHIMLGEWIMEFERRFEYDARASDLSTTIQGSPTVVISPLLLTQLLDILIRNAFRYSSPGTPVRLSVTTTGKEVEIAVNDEGIGVPVAEREAIFEPFYRSSVSRKSGISGTGLGLSIARRIASLSGGSIECRNRESGGSTFVLVLCESDAAEDTATRRI